MSDRWTCKHCHGEKHRDVDGPPVIMPRPWKPLTGCRDCRDLALACPQAQQFHVERNHKAGGTSAQAAHAAAEGARLGDTHKLIWRALHEKPMTADEVAAATGLNLLTARPRCSDLRKAGFIEPTGETRATECGRQADVYRAVTKSEQGRAVA